MKREVGEARHLKPQCVIPITRRPCASHRGLSCRKTRRRVCSQWARGQRPLMARAPEMFPGAWAELRVSGRDLGWGCDRLEAGKLAPCQLWVLFYTLIGYAWEQLRHSSRMFHGQRSLAGYSPWGCRVRHDWATFTPECSLYQPAGSWTLLRWLSWVPPWTSSQPSS